MPKFLGFVLRRYRSDALAVLVKQRWDDGEIEENPLSVNVDNEYFKSKWLKPGLFCAKNYSENQELYRQMIADGLIEQVEDKAQVPTGMVEVPICRLTYKGKAAILENHSPDSQN